MERKLATIQTIKDIQPIPNADKIDVCSVLGWKVVSRKGEFKVGEQAIYLEIDSLLPFTSWSEFLRDQKNPEKPIRLRSKKLRGQVSQGLLLPLSILPETIHIYQEGEDVTQALNVILYVPPIPACLSGQVRGSFPSVCPKSDEMRIQSYPDVLKELKGKEVYWSVKMDGTSASFMNIDGDIHVCSRNLSLKETEGNTYWKVFRKYDLENVLKDAGSFSISGEVCGPSIQKNTAGLKDHELFVFNVYDIKNGRFLDFVDFKGFCSKYHLTTVPIDRTGMFSFETVDGLVDEATRVKYANGSRAEGYVIRPVVEGYSDVLSGRLSVKVINNEYLLKNED